jgi:GNAT superfamily N-acetyltransferase
MAYLAEQLGYPSMGAQVRVRLEEMRDSDRYAVYVAEIFGGTIGGWIGVYVCRTVEMDSWAIISGLIVDQTIRSQGIGKALLRAAEDWARRRGCGAISVLSNVKRDRAHRFYRSNGYEHIKTQKSFLKHL